MKKGEYLNPIEIDKRYQHYPGPFAIDNKCLNKIFPGIQKIKTKEYHQFVKGEMELPNLSYINKLVKYLKPKISEIRHGPHVWGTVPTKPPGSSCASSWIAD